MRNKRIQNIILAISAAIAGGFFAAQTFINQKIYVPTGAFGFHKTLEHITMPLVVNGIGFIYLALTLITVFSVYRFEKRAKAAIISFLLLLASFVIVAFIDFFLGYSFGLDVLLLLPLVAATIIIAPIFIFLVMKAKVKK